MPRIEPEGTIAVHVHRPSVILAPGVEQETHALISVMLATGWIDSVITMKDGFSFKRISVQLPARSHASLWWGRPLKLPEDSVLRATCLQGGLLIRADPDPRVLAPPWDPRTENWEAYVNRIWTCSAGSDAG